MNSAQRLAQWQLDFDAICGPVVKQPKRLTGIAKEALEPEPIEEEYKRWFVERRGDTE